MVKPNDYLFEFTQYKKSETNLLLIQQQFAEIRSVSSAYSAIYTDGSNDGDKSSIGSCFQTGGLLYSITICQLDLQCRR